jgi:uncharacterized protein (TIGR03663 family)
VTRRTLFIALILAVAAGALAFRLPRLALRPMHTDEAVNAAKCGELFDKGVYRYDRSEYHGPTLYYFSLPFLWLSPYHSYAETSETVYRLVPVAFGVGLILLLLLAGDGFGRPAAAVAGVLTAISPAVAFYSRYYIHELLLVFFTFGAIAAGWRYAMSRRIGWAILAGAFLGLMHATKETALVAYAAMGLAVSAKLRWRRWWGYPIRIGPLINGRHVAAALAAAAATSVLFYSSFFTNLRGPLDSLRAYTSYLSRGAGAAGLHDQPWHYYLKTLIFTQHLRGPWWTEGLILVLAIFGFVSVMVKTSAPEARAPLVRFVAFYTLFLTAAYSIIPYKTPWCMLGFLHGMILLAGVGAVVLVELVPTRAAKGLACLLLALAAYHLAGQAYKQNFTFYRTDRSNPYVYAHTSTDLMNLVQRVEDIAQVAPEGHDMVIKVIAPESDYWPLPWYLRRFPKVGYWSELPQDPDAAIVIAAIELRQELEARLRGKYFTEIVGLRPSVHLLAYIRQDLWDAFLKTREGPGGGGG